MFAMVAIETVWSSGYFDIFTAIFHKAVVVLCPFFALICLLLTLFSGWSCSKTILSLELRSKLLSFDLPIRQSSHNPVVYPLPLRLPVDILLKLSLKGFVVWKWRFRLVDAPHRSVRLLLHKEFLGDHDTLGAIADHRHTRLVLVNQIRNSKVLPLLQDLDYDEHRV